MISPSMPKDDLGALALCLWREARSLGSPGMLGVANVVHNRTVKHGTTFAHEVYRPWQFSSMSDPDDPQLNLYPKADDSAFADAHRIAALVIGKQAADNTLGATLYYADYIPFPASWDKSKVVPTVTIGNTHFFRET